jgi:release factor glutamine methyltransferase
MNVAQALVAAAGRGVERLDAQLLLLRSLGRSETDRGWLLAHDDEALSTEGERAYFALCDRRASGEPLAYIVGHKEFHGLDLHVDARVLVPRPDTETLVDWAIELLEERDNGRVIDLGTGSGAIALALRKSCPRAEVEATDTSAAALDVARANASRLGLEVTFRQASWLDGAKGRYDLIASNPPYVASGDGHLPALAHEPASALVSGPDGLDAIRSIVEQAPAHLAGGGWLLLEHGHDQGAAVRSLLKGTGFGYIASRRDLAGIERVTGGQWLEIG